MRAGLPRLIAITDLGVLAAPALVLRLSALARRATPGRLAILLRDHEAGLRDRLRLGRQLRSLTREAGQLLWVADRLDLALLLQADGAHLGESSVSARDARRLLGPDVHVSRAWHRSDLDGCEKELDGVDALLLSPLFAARKGRAALGASALTALGAALEMAGRATKLYALGGVTEAEVAACDAAGAAGVAAIGAALVEGSTALLDALGIRRPSGSD